MSTLGVTANEPAGQSTTPDASASQGPIASSDDTRTATLSILTDRFHSEALTFVQANPGVTSRELAQHLLAVCPVGVVLEPAIDFLQDAGCRVVSDTATTADVDGYRNARWWPPDRDIAKAARNAHENGDDTESARLTRELFRPAS